MPEPTSTPERGTAAWDAAICNRLQAITTDMWEAYADDPMTEEQLAYVARLGRELEQLAKEMCEP